MRSKPQSVVGRPMQLSFIDERRGVVVIYCAHADYSLASLSGSDSRTALGATKPFIKPYICLSEYVYMCMSVCLRVFCYEIINLVAVSDRLHGYNERTTRL